MADNITFEIVEHIGTITPATENAWAKELNRISWCGGPIKWDVRQFDESHTKCSRGITLTDAEMHSIIELLADRF